MLRHGVLVTPWQVVEHTHPNWFSLSRSPATKETNALAASFAAVKLVVVGAAFDACTKLRMHLEVGGDSY